MSTKDVVRGRDARPEARRDVDVTAGDSVTVALADAVAAATGVDVTDLDGTLHETIDLDAVEILLRHAAVQPDVEWEMSFRLAGHEVTVAHDGRLVVW